MITEQEAKAIIEEYTSRGRKANTHLAKLMQYEGLETLVFRVHTPSFNDGDPCEFTVDFIGKPNCLLVDYYAVVKGTAVKVMNLWDCDDDSEFPEEIPEEAKQILLMDSGPYGSQQAKAKREALKTLEPVYKLEGFEDTLEKIAPFILESNTEGTITLTGDTIKINAEEYYCGY